MNGDRIFPPTTERSSHIGQDGYGFESDWRHFLDKYREASLRFVQKCFPSRLDLAEDAFSQVLAKLVTNPNVIHRKPSVRFRSLLATLLRNAAVDLIRQEKGAARARYEKLTDATYAPASFDCDRRRRQLLVIDLIRRDLLRENYENGRFSREYRSLDLDIWRELQNPDATCRSAARKFGCSWWEIYGAKQRVETRIRDEATSLLTSLGLL